MKQIYWLASYPKSGNTWMRVFLTNYERNSGVPANINQLETTTALNLRQHFDELMCIDSAHLDAREIDELRPVYYRLFAGELASKKRVYCKIHDAYQKLSTGEPHIPSDISAGIIYIVRSPLDVAVSYAHHNNQSIDSIICSMADNNHSLAGTRNSRSFQLHQRLLSWSEHVRSWIEQSHIPTIVLRYEDLTTDPNHFFSQIVGFIGDHLDQERVRAAIENSSFKELQKQEVKSGFKEKLPQAQSFFRKGKVGDWRNILTPAQVDQIVQDHREMMKRFDYFPF
jgi:hypothetical protein